MVSFSCLRESAIVFQNLIDSVEQIRNNSQIEAGRANMLSILKGSKMSARSAAFAMLVMTNVTPYARAQAAADDDLKSWFEQTKQIQKQYRESLPSNIQRELERSTPELRPFVFQNESRTLARGDFNCDGKQDYAVTVVQAASKLSEGFADSDPVEHSLSDLKQEYHRYSYDEPAEVVIVLSSSSGFLIKRASASYASNSGSSCGCCNSVSAADQELIKKLKCDFLYLGCCEKDGSYTIYEKDSLTERFTDGC